LSETSATTTQRSPDLVLARLHLRLGSLSLARAELETLAGKDMLDADGVVDLAEARWRTGDITGAGEAAALVIDDDDGPLLALVVAAEAAAAGKSVELAMAIVKKLHPALVERQGLAEIESVLGQCLESLKQEPRLVAYVHSARLDALQERLTQLSGSAGFEGRVVLIGDDAMGESDCRVEWADGGVEREAGRIRRSIEDALTRYIAADDRDPK